LKPQSNTRTELTSSSRALTTEEKHMEHECLNSDTETKQDQSAEIQKPHSTNKTTHMDRRAKTIKRQ